MNIKKAWPVSLMPVVVLGVSLAQPAFADDIEVFNTGVKQKPNVLFVFDRSGSMKRDVNGVVTDNLDERRATILQNAFSVLLEQNEERINAGLGPFYRSRESGVKWPVGDLTQDASEIDTDIAANSGFTSRVVIDRLFESSSVWGGTDLVDALYESVLYFRGDPVRAGGGTWDGRYNPDVWNPVSEKFEGGDYRAPHPATYSPRDAFEADAVPIADQTGTCQDFSVGGTATGFNECADSWFTRVDNCTHVPVAAGVGTVCGEWEYNCASYSIDGECTDGGWVCGFDVPAADIPAHDRCDWYREGLFEGKWHGANYNSPIADSCQSNFIVLLSDGDPTSRFAQEEIKSLVGIDSCEDLSTSIFSSISSANANDGDCGVELVKFAAENDQQSTVPNSTVKTFTIGFGVVTPGQQYLKKLAEVGGGDFYAATDADQLAQAFDSIVDSIAGGSESFAAVSVDIDKASFSSDNRAFFSFFEPDHKRSWQGNLKGYFIDRYGINDVTGLSAIEETAGGAVFKDTSQSFWSTAPDGNNVLSGGAGEKLLSGTRNLYTFTGDSVPASGADLTEPEHELIGTNDLIKPEMLQGEDRSIVDWVRTAPMADPLHTQPVTIKYDGRTVVYVMTNQGLLHAIDASAPTVSGDTTGGSELWAFMPQALLHNIPDLKAEASTGSHIYGLDGGMTRWLDETGNGNGVIESGETAMLYIGMRRGGSHYYAIDVSNPLQPRLEWRIKGGSSDFRRLGQTWSRMSLVSMKVDSTVKKVLVFGGGYDASLDGSTDRQTVDAFGNSIKGNDIYLVDALTGSLIWSANNTNTLPDMHYAIPSDVSVIDSDADGLADRAYLGDLGGQIWRLDFKQGQISRPKGVTVTRIASLGSDSSFHPFFYQPSVAVMNNRLGEYLAITLGSGSRDNPLYPDSSNAVFMIKDTNVDSGAPADTSGWPIVTSDLHDATQNNISATDATVAASALTELKAKSGWMVTLATGEKVLAKTTVLQNQLHFSTYMPDSTTSATDSCSAKTSIGRYYKMDIVDARPVDNLNGSTGADKDTFFTTADRSVVVSNHGIPGSVTMVFPKDANSVQVYVDKKKVGEIPQKLVNVLWYENQ